jgi:hypothetical protein
MFPRKIPSAAFDFAFAPSLPIWPAADVDRRDHGWEYSRRSHKYPPAGSPRASTIFGFVVTRILRPQHAPGQSGGSSHREVADQKRYLRIW